MIHLHVDENNKVLCFYCNGTGMQKKGKRKCLVCGNSTTPGRMSADLLKPFMQRLRRRTPGIRL